MPIIKLKDVELYYDEFGSGDRYLIQAQQYTNNKLHYTIDLAKQGFHVFNIQIRGYAPSTPVHEDLGRPGMMCGRRTFAILRISWESSLFLYGLFPRRGYWVAPLYESS